MTPRTPWIVGAALVLLAGMSARAEIQVVVERNEEAGLAAGFKFNNVPAPARNDAASKAEITLVAGRADDNGGNLKVLNDGKVPTEQDQPGRNFFFGQGEERGRVVIDLGQVIECRQVNTYSWHPGSRGPQVYTLYAADGTERDFDARPKRGIDPEKCGWKRVAAVDTRPASGAGGGQHGVSIGDSAGAIGKYRYWLWDISATTQENLFGNTFYSEIDVIDAADKEASEAGADPVVRSVSKSPNSAAQEITIDYTEAPELKDWVENTLQPTVDEWYPKIVQDLPSEGYTAPARVAIVITADYRGVAATAGTRVFCDVDWFKKNFDGEGAGAVVHELVHVVQQYGPPRTGSEKPGWLVEGIADYIRWFKYEPKPSGTRPRNPERANYTDSYRTTAGFLNYVVLEHDPQIVAKLSAALRARNYNADLWTQYTGKTVVELWQQYVETLKQ